MADAREVARTLTKARKAALTVLPAWGFPAGHNNYPDVEYHRTEDPDSHWICNGEEVDWLLRSGLAEAGEREADGGVHLVDEDLDCEPRWPINLTPLGLEVRAILQAEGEGANGLR